MYFILIGAAVLLVLFYGLYVSVIRKRNAVEEAFSGIDVQLTKRHDLIPNVIATAKKFMTHEKSLMEDITELRTSAMKAAEGKDLGKVLKTEAALGAKLGQLLISVENYPNLKSDTTMLEVQEALEDTEEHIAASRRFYNSAVRVLNDSIHIWPASMVASWLKIKPYPYFEADEKAKAPVDAEKMFS